MSQKKAKDWANKDFEYLAQAIEGLHDKGASDREIFRLLILTAGSVINFGAIQTFNSLKKIA